MLEKWWSEKPFFQSETLPLHSCKVDVCDCLKCNQIGHAVSKCGESMFALTPIINRKKQISYTFSTSSAYKHLISCRNKARGQITLALVNLISYAIDTYKKNSIHQPTLILCVRLTSFSIIKRNDGLHTLLKFTSLFSSTKLHEYDQPGHSSDYLIVVHLQPLAQQSRGGDLVEQRCRDIRKVKKGLFGLQSCAREWNGDI